MVDADAVGEEEELLEERRLVGAAEEGGERRARRGALGAVHGRPEGVRPELTAPGEHGGEHAEEAVVLLVRGSPVDPFGERHLVLRRAFLQQWSERHARLDPHARRLPAQHLNQPPPHRLRLVERRRRRPGAQDGEAGAGFEGEERPTRGRVSDRDGETRPEPALDPARLGFLVQARQAPERREPRRG